MDLLKLLNATGQQDQLVKVIAGQFGLDPNQAGSAISGIMGALSGGVQNQVKQGNIQNIMDVAQNNQVQQYVEQPEQVTNAQSQGNDILGLLLGSKDASRQVASNVSQQSGVSADIIKQILPMVAAMAMGSMGKAGQQSGGSSDALSGMLGSLLDQDGDGSFVDDVFGMLGKK